MWTRPAGRNPGTTPALFGLAGRRPGAGDPTPGAPPHHRARGFANTNPAFELHTVGARLRFLLSRQWASLADPPSVDLPRVPNDGQVLRDARHDATITWVGHSTFLVQLAGANILTDPQWSARASPFSFLGPRRLTPPGLAFDDLPPIHVVVISHDHYDHLDAPTVTRLAATHRPLFLVPLGLRTWFSNLGVGTVDELDWWDSRALQGVTFTCLPAQHWSGRSLWETNRRLWCGWPVASPTRRLFFAGDTGCYDGLREIGARVGPFDLALVSIGAYTPARIMGMTHTTPEEAIRVLRDVKAGRLVAMHWGTFNLAEEPIDEPPRRLARAARGLGMTTIASGCWRSARRDAGERRRRHAARSAAARQASRAGERPVRPNLARRERSRDRCPAHGRRPRVRLVVRGLIAQRSHARRGHRARRSARHSPNAACFREAEPPPRYKPWGSGSSVSSSAGRALTRGRALYSGVAVLHG